MVRIKMKKKTGNAIRISTSQKIFDTINILFMFCFMILMLYPMYYVVVASFSSAARLMGHTGFLFSPLKFSTAAYKSVLNNSMIPTGYRNTLFIVIVGTLINVTLTSFGAYFLSRKGQTIGKIVGLYILFTMFFSGGMIPIYLNVDSLGLTNKLWALIIPNAINTFYLFIMRTAFKGIPDSMEESAKLDGAHHLTILLRIYLPLSKAVIAVMVLYYGVDHWNSWFNAMLYIRDRTLYPLQLILREILIANDTQFMVNLAVDAEMVAETIKYAVIVVVTVPVLCLYPFLQKYFVKGVMIGAIKG